MLNDHVIPFGHGRWEQISDGPIPFEELPKQLIPGGGAKSQRRHAKLLSISQGQATKSPEGYIHMSNNLAQFWCLWCIINNYLLNTLKDKQIIESCLEPFNISKSSKYYVMMPDLPECKLNANIAVLGARARCWGHLTQWAKNE